MLSVRYLTSIILCDLTKEREGRVGEGRRWKRQKEKQRFTSCLFVFIAALDTKQLKFRTGK